MQVLMSSQCAILLYRLGMMWGLLTLKPLFLNRASRCEWQQTPYHSTFASDPCDNVLSCMGSVAEAEQQGNQAEHSTPQCLHG